MCLRSSLLLRRSTEYDGITGRLAARVVSLRVFSRVPCPRDRLHGVRESVVAETIPSVGTLGKAKSVRLLCEAMPIPSTIFGRWQHSHEEDANETEVYRPESYALPLSRGRKGFEIREEGDFIELAIAPTDGIDETVGKWSPSGNEALEIVLENGRSYEIQIVAAGEDVLEIKRK